MGKRYAAQYSREMYDYTISDDFKARHNEPEILGWLQEYYDLVWRGTAKLESDWDWVKERNRCTHPIHWTNNFTSLE
jgi:hypothetical protein